MLKFVIEDELIINYELGTSLHASADRFRIRNYNYVRLCCEGLCEGFLADVCYRVDTNYEKLINDFGEKFA
ncbi:MAG: hypothetical protein A2275_03515 [Bacteroidetes bacterium RIFOXYA12_FULL_35_11]|nr:MAG: hypothetical protein A2X01_05525 [Bacteroidetes bacterium GWF2_35_48]OFY81938.1 MAG: hypothetical protein A2275_03515 [Bacteroidetes bacterium RIFOXYA12_FULL_35_11]OFY92193.1 MAG: hypothetical protein A2309_03810 [Bacteroidetes bacterium RIFOXYB2_FULL_35_7]OFZ05913.1 MAG: hypothetical protein A2491_16465 [Bacteroidetes bacterium RIFOXYC12_FULL_35_7]HBX52215.1 hypothetical protein [Bacteroidales bacterium]